MNDVMSSFSSYILIWLYPKIHLQSWEMHNWMLSLLTNWSLGRKRDHGACLIQIYEIDTHEPIPIRLFHKTTFKSHSGHLTFWIKLAFNSFPSSSCTIFCLFGSIFLFFCRTSLTMGNDIQFMFWYHLRDSEHIRKRPGKKYPCVLIKKKISRATPCIVFPTFTIISSSISTCLTLSTGSRLDCNSVASKSLWSRDWALPT
jgi:hypothetical protein